MDPERLSLDRASVVAKRSTARNAPRHKAGEKFLRGPIPWDWVTAAARASGRGSGFKVGLALWHLSGLAHQRRTIDLQGRVLRELGVGRHATYRGLADLEHAGLVAVERHPGRMPRVTLLDASGECGDES